MKRIFLACMVAMLTRQLVRSQESSLTAVNPPRCELYGRVLTPSSLSESRLEIQLAGDKTTPRQKTKLVNGTFEFKGVPPGPYQFRILDQFGKIILQTTVQINGTGDHVLMRIPPEKREPFVGNVVSFRQLHRKIDGKAMKAFEEAERAAASGQTQKSISCYQKAISIDGNFPQAEVSLAVQYMSLGQEEEALRHAQSAYDLDSDLPETGHTLALLLNHARRYREAETVLRFMLKTWDEVGELNGWLAVSLIGQLRTEEGLKYLGRSADEFPTARLLAANVLLETHQIDLAVVQVSEYMRSFASACERQELEQWIASVAKPQMHLTSGR